MNATAAAPPKRCELLLTLCLGYATILSMLQTMILYGPSGITAVDLMAVGNVNAP